MTSHDDATGPEETPGKPHESESAGPPVPEQPEKPDAESDKEGSEPEPSESGQTEPARPEDAGTEPRAAEQGTPERKAPQPPRRGRVSRQEPGVTAPRPPTVGEARAREQARKRNAEIERIHREAEEKRRKRNRRLIGGAAIVGVVALVAVGYQVLSSHDNVTARCVRDENGQEVVVEDRYCGGSPGLNGIFLVGGSQYRYYYGGTGTIGGTAIGGTTVKPKGAEIKTPSGTTIQRGGLGAKVGGSSGS